MPLLRLQLSCPPWRDRRGALPGRLSAGALSFRATRAGTLGHKRLFRRGHALADAAARHGRDSRCHRLSLDVRPRRGDHPRSQSHQRGGGEFQRLRRRRRQSPVARGAGAGRRQSEGSRAPAHGGRSAGRLASRASNLQSRVVRSDLRARRTIAQSLGGRTHARAFVRGRSSLALPADHRRRDAVRRAA